MRTFLGALELLSRGSIESLIMSFNVSKGGHKEREMQGSKCSSFKAIVSVKRRRKTSQYRGTVY